MNYMAMAGWKTEDMLSGIEGIIAQQWGADFHYRAEDRDLAYEHVLMVKGPDVVAYAESLGYDVTQDPEKDYGFRFTERTKDLDHFRIHFESGPGLCLYSLKVIISGSRLKLFKRA